MQSAIEDVMASIPDDFLGILHACDGYYSCPKDPSGKRLGPMVGYAAQYEAGLHYVGDVYVNFAMAEERGEALDHFANHLSVKLRGLISDGGVVFCGAPEGGKALATALAIRNRQRYVFPEIKVTGLATAGSREQKKLVWGRHLVGQGDRVIIVEDVTNNFSTTKELIALIQSAGAEVIAIVSFLNRSLDHDSDFEGIPIISLVRQVIMEYRQDDPEVAADIETGNVVWKPKLEWARLMEAMAAHQG